MFQSEFQSEFRWEFQWVFRWEFQWEFPWSPRRAGSPSDNRAALQEGTWRCWRPYWTSSRSLQRLMRNLRHEDAHNKGFLGEFRRFSDHQLRSASHSHRIRTSVASPSLSYTLSGSLRGRFWRGSCFAPR